MTSLRNPLATLLTITTALVCAPWACSGPGGLDQAEVRVHLVLPPQAYGLTKGSDPHSIEETPLVLDEYPRSYVLWVYQMRGKTVCPND